MPSASQGAEQQLLEVYTWAGQELVAAVLAAMQGDTAAAAAALADMVADSSSSSYKSGSKDSAGGSRAGQAPAAALSCAQGACDDDEEGTAEEQQDPYFRHRRRALQLSRRWARAARGAGTAYAAGDHSAARQLAADAQRLRREVLAAHAEAAERIEEANNRGNSLLELDLHGLHATEAVAALQRRLHLLHSLLADPATAAALPGRPALRVVVGRGAHSSGGEASIPRVVESHLRGAGLRFSPRLGALDVQLRTPAALSSGATGS
ncbi:hypothetical protein ABPG75_003950 [Micractinium tetrahymenae]